MMLILPQQHEQPTVSNHVGILRRDLSQHLRSDAFGLVIRGEHLLPFGSLGNLSSASTGAGFPDIVGVLHLSGIDLSYHS